MALDNNNLHRGMPKLIVPEKNCSICPRLATFRNNNNLLQPTWHNAPVLSFGSLKSELLIVGLAPGLRGANRTGRPFTGDAAGAMLYPALIHYDWANGEYTDECYQKLSLNNCRITNAVRCVPPQNKPTGQEVTNCKKFLVAELAAMPNVRAILTLGVLAHNTTVKILNLRRKDFPFYHGTVHSLPEGLFLIDSYHCSRYNVNTGRLTKKMFYEVFEHIKNLLQKQ